MERLSLIADTRWSRFAGNIVLMLTYGAKPTDSGAEGMVNLVDEAMDQFSETTVSGAFLVDVFPIRKYSNIQIRYPARVLPLCER